MCKCLKSKVENQRHGSKKRKEKFARKENQAARKEKKSLRERKTRQQKKKRKACGEGKPEDK